MLDPSSTLRAHQPSSHGSMHTRSHGRKRHFAEAYSIADPEASLPPTKKSKSNAEPLELQPTAKFWDLLSKLWLTRRALKELERRTAQPARPAPVGQCNLSREDYTNEIKRFARHGGPDLCDLRGVRLI